MFGLMRKKRYDAEIEKMLMQIGYLNQKIAYYRTEWSHCEEIRRHLAQELKKERESRCQPKSD